MVKFICFSFRLIFLYDSMTKLHLVRIALIVVIRLWMFKWFNSLKFLTFTSKLLIFILCLRLIVKFLNLVFYVICIFIDISFLHPAKSSHNLFKRISIFSELSSIWNNQYDNGRFLEVFVGMLWKDKTFVRIKFFEWS